LILVSPTLDSADWLVLECSLSISLLFKQTMFPYNSCMESNYKQLPLLQFSELEVTKPDGQENIIKPQDRAFHRWYRFVLSFPPHLVRDYLDDFGLTSGNVILDPFCGTGTTIVEAKLNGIAGIGLEANPFPRFASQVKIDWRIDPDELLENALEIAEAAYQSLSAQGIDDRMLTCEPGIELRNLPSHSERALIKNSISPLPLHKTLVLLDLLKAQVNLPFYKYELLALGSALVNSIGNLRFGPEVGVGKIKKDMPVVAAWLAEVRKMVADLHLVTETDFPKSIVHLADARELHRFISPNSVDAVITSPPYPNEKDYTRTTRLESVVLEFFEDMSHLRKLKKTLIRSNTRGVYKADDDDKWIADNAEIQRLADEIERRRLELGKTSGFEKLYPRVTKLYFGGMARHLSELSSVLRPGAMLAYVVGDQASYLRVMIRTGQILADIAEKLGYKVERIDLFRTRFATATQSELREEVVILRWPRNQK
jgi:tRNA G10  N-methylase Trm11